MSKRYLLTVLIYWFSIRKLTHAIYLINRKKEPQNMIIFRDARKQLEKNPTLIHNKDAN
jgi:hypothetical protein